MAIDFNAIKNEWKARTTKTLYYDNVGDSISKDEYNKRVEDFSKANLTTFGSPEKDKQYDDAVIYNENRKALAQGANLYEITGVTGDLGKYQVNPANLNTNFTKVWLGKNYTPEEFKKDPEAQEKFYKMFKEKIAKRYRLTPEQALIAWHQGWGLVGSDNEFDIVDRKIVEKKDKKGKPIRATYQYKREKFIANLDDKIKNDKESQRYLNEVRHILNNK